MSVASGIVLDQLDRRGGAVLNAGLGVLLVAGTAFQVLLVGSSHGAWWFDLVSEAAVVALALLRARSRLWTATAALALAGAGELAAAVWHLPGQPGPAAALALLVLTGSAVRVLPLWQAGAVAAGGAAVAAGSIERYLFFLDAGRPNAYTATRLFCLGWGVAVGTGLVLRLLDARRAYTVEKVRRGERLELARELHDAAAHHITALVVQAQAARVVARKDPGALDGALAGIESAGADALNAMRRVIGLLRDDGDGDAGGLSTGPEQLADLVARFAGLHPGTRLELPDGPPGTDWPPELTATVYRIVQEALTNVARHAAQAGSVLVRLAHDERGVTVSVTDDAAAGAPVLPHQGGYGLTGMRERVEALGGTLHAGPGGPAGWSVRATLPAALPADAAGLGDGGDAADGAAADGASRP